MNRIRVLLADDHQMFVAGLRRLLEPEFEVVGTVEDGRGLIDAVANLKPDVVVCDVSMPGLNGIDAAKRLNSTGDGPKIVFLTMHGDALYRREAVRSGAFAYILKKDAPEKLTNAINAAYRGERSLEEETGARPTLPGITERQREIWQLLAEGRSPKQIAALLRVSSRTVEFHKYNLMRRLNVKTSAELATAAVRHGLIASGQLNPVEPQP